jgi:hypothetical protein
MRSHSNLGVTHQEERTFQEIIENFTEEQRKAFAVAAENYSKALEEGTRLHFERSDGGRAAAAMQLDALIDFVEALNPDDEQCFTLPLRTLNALYDLDQGVVAPILKPGRVRGRGRDTTARFFTRLNAAWAMQLLMDIGLDRKNASAAVAVVLREGGITLKRRGDDGVIGADAVAKWREQIQSFAKRDPHSPVAKLYHRNLDVWRLQIQQLQRNGPDQKRPPQLQDIILRNLSVFLIEHGESYDPKISDLILQKRSMRIAYLPTLFPK